MEVEREAEEEVVVVVVVVDGVSVESGEEVEGCSSTSDEGGGAV